MAVHKQIRGGEKPLTAAIDCPAIGIGTTLCFHCDLVYAAREARFQMPFIYLCLVPEAGSPLLARSASGARRRCTPSAPRSNHPRRTRRFRRSCPRRGGSCTFGRRLDFTGSRCFDADAELMFGAKATSMLRVTALFWISIATLGVAIAEDAKQDTVQVHGKSLTLSCAEWKRNQDASWTNISPLQVGTEIVTNVTLRGASATKSLETKCRNGSSPSDTPAPHGDQTRHMKHMHHPAEPAGGTETPAN